MWTIEQYLTPPMGVLRCTLCGVERMGNTKQAKAGKLRCWTCIPRPEIKTRAVAERPARPSSPPSEAKKPKKAKEKPIEGPFDPRWRKPPPVATPAPPVLEGRVPLHGNSYSRAVRHQVDTDEGGTQHVRIEIMGLRTKNPQNKRLTWMAAQAAIKQAQTGAMHALEWALPRPLDGLDCCYEIRLSRITTKGGMDDDGVAASLKGVRDAIAVFLRVNDGNRRRFRVTYGVGHGEVQGVIIEWLQREGTFPDEALESYKLFERDECRVIAGEHRVQARYWKERMAKRLLSRTERVAGAGNDEAEEDAAYDADEGEDDEG